MDENVAEQCFQQLFIKRAEYKIIQCIQCQYAISPANIHGHLRDKHKKAIDPKCRKGVAKYVTEKIEGVA